MFNKLFLVINIYLLVGYALPTDPLTNLNGPSPEGIKHSKRTLPVLKIDYETYPQFAENICMNGPRKVHSAKPRRCNSQSNVATRYILASDNTGSGSVWGNFANNRGSQKPGYVLRDGIDLAEIKVVNISNTAHFCLAELPGPPAGVVPQPSYSVYLTSPSDKISSQLFDSPQPPMSHRQETANNVGITRGPISSSDLHVPQPSAQPTLDNFSARADWTRSDEKAMVNSLGIGSGGVGIDEHSSGVVHHFHTNSRRHRRLKDSHLTKYVLSTCIITSQPDWDNLDYTLWNQTFHALLENKYIPGRRLCYAV
ncbi:hypothetical protein EDD18DRAFT_1107654 [Armillaria luteobubalina]|uniref:Uncharacterized protein n=1 Tax=Armillaria luteobubalina TaxID=153913 RepID=A0AA39Q1Y6_9AGAR|nr:hypothetical protein EDD18DRAFT_1107654 [Armillaria luteobubalina]